MLTDLPGVLVSRLQSAFAAHADGKRAAGARAYMRDQFAFYGIPAPAQKVIDREARAGLPAPTEAQLASVVTACWRKPEREWQYFACGYLRRYVGGKSPKLLETAREAITTKSWWDTVDSLAIHTVGALVAEHPRLVREMDRFIRSDDIWIARTAILHQITYRTDTDVDRLFSYCLARAADREFFIRKAIGWALREYTKTDARAVRAFVRTHADLLSGLSKSEALKWLERRAARGR